MPTARILPTTLLLTSVAAFSLPLNAQTPQAAGDDAPAPAPQVQQDVVRTIAVSGAERLEAQTILSYIKLRPGDVWTQAAGDAVLKDLYATELFSNASVVNTNGDVVITIVENPVINRIILEGNKRLKNDKILPEIKLSPRQIFTRSKVRADVARIIELYKRQGRFAATVEPQMVELSQNRVDIVFEISEGPKSKVRQINIIGNEAFPDDTIKDQMLTKETRITSLLSGNTSYDPDRLAFDQQKLRQFYLTEGYADFRVVSAVAELTPDQHDFIITYVVEEGERYKFGKLDVDSRLRDFDSKAMTARLSMKGGDWYDAKLVEDTVEQMSELAGTFGYAFADVAPQFSRNPEDKTMDVTFVLREAPRVYVERIDVNGNTLTQDKVVRREFRLAEGDAFNSLSVARSTARINSLGYFQENFEINQVEGSAPDRIVLEANVEEQPTGELQLSLGYSSTENFILAGSIRQRNFRGRGQTVGLSANLSGTSKSVSASFSDPYVFDRNLSFGAEIYRRDYNNSSSTSDNNATYSQTTTGVTARLGVPLSEYLSLIGSYTLNLEEVMLDEDTYFSDLDGDGTNSCEPLLAGRYLCDAIGTRVNSILGATLNYNSLDSRLHPTRGTSWSLGIDLAGLGGDSRYGRVRGQWDHYLNFGSGFVLNAHGEGGYLQNFGGDETRLTDRFFLGEPSIRGFDIRGIGPAVERTYLVSDGDGGYEAGTVNREALGGNAYYLGRLEMDLPLGSGVREMGIRPSLFLDMGSVFSLSSPALSESPYPEGTFIATTDEDGNALYSQTFDVAGDGETETIYTTSKYAPDGSLNTALGTTVSPFTEAFVGNTWKPRISVGVGVNWNSPMGPLRINLAHILAKQDSDDTKVFSFNVGTSF